MFHFAGNAFLRTYQLLVSPSVVTYLIREQFYNFTPRQSTIEDTFSKKVEYSLYMLCIKEFNLDSFMYRFLWNPIKWAGKKLDFLTVNKVIIIFIPFYLIGLFCVYNKEYISAGVQESLPLVFSLIGLLMVLKSFSERRHARLSWLLIIMNHFWVALAVSFNEHFTFDQVHIYLSGIAVAGLVGFWCLRNLKQHEGSIDLDQFHGHAYKHPKMSVVFLLCCLGASGFPITPTFIGEDLMFSHIHEDQAIFALVVSLSFIIDGLSIMRIYARVFLGPHVKSQYDMAYRSS
jgi:NADH-quinone oxidoreductase subunit L